MSLVKAGLAVALAALTIVACSGSQGDSCTSDSDCDSQLSCQPIKGRTQNFCCPAPAESSDYANCHAALTATTTAPSSGSPADAAAE